MGSEYHSFDAMEMLATTFRKTDTDYQHEVKPEPIYSVEWIERAGTSFAEWFKTRFKTDKKVKVFCGIGDNGATGLAMASELRQMGFYVKVYLVQHTYPPSLAFNRFRNLIPAFKWIWVDEDMPRITENDIVIDAILGTGLNREIGSTTGFAIDTINNSGAKIVSLDIASGLFANKHTVNEFIINPDFTLTFTLPKIAFLLPENEKYVGEYFVMDIGMKPERVIHNEKHHFVSAGIVKSFFRKRGRFISQADLGNALLITGCQRMLGSAVLAAKACLRSGAGSLTLQVPGYENVSLQTVLPEAIVESDKNKNYIADIPELSKFMAVGIGVGMDENATTYETFENLLRRSPKSLILSNDAVKIICRNRYLLARLPENSVLILEAEDFKQLTDHDAEIKFSQDFERLEALRKFAARYKIVVVFRAGTTYTILPNGEIYFNLTGNTGLVTAGT
ncbi:MAG: NAD(P)H-hydrate epimerase, partial [Verrucomicrobia bacterium]|nr:NAD(P)H-hydrate epimerase [Cytophagales bacterium]